MVILWRAVENDTLKRPVLGGITMMVNMVGRHIGWKSVAVMAQVQ